VCACVQNESVAWRYAWAASAACGLEQLCAKFRAMIIPMLCSVLVQYAVWRKIFVAKATMWGLDEAAPLEVYLCVGH
jgi:hypothetical protein